MTKLSRVVTPHVRSMMIRYTTQLVRPIPTRIVGFIREKLGKCQTLSLIGAGLHVFTSIVLKAAKRNKETMR